MKSSAKIRSELSTADNESSYWTISTVLSSIGPVFAVVVPTLYLIGRVYAESYWAKLDLSSTLMDYALHDYLYFGFVSIVNGMFRLISKLPVHPIGAWIITGVVFAILLSALALFRRTYGNALRLATFRAIRRTRSRAAKGDGWIDFGLRPFLISFQWSSTVFLYLLVPLFIIGVLILGAVLGGQFQASKDLAAHRRVGAVGPYEHRAVVHISGQAVNQSGILFECSSRWCVVLRRGQVVAVPAQSVESIDHCPKTNSLSNGALVCDAEARVVP